MDKISDVYVKPITESMYIKPQRIHYTQDGCAKTWDMIHRHDSVATVVYNKSRDVLVFVKQFRPAVYWSSSSRLQGNQAHIDTDKYQGSLGITYELCAGIVDKDSSLMDIARTELLEECGYDVPLQKIEKVTSYKSVGLSGDIQTLFYAEVTDEMKVSAGGGNKSEGEMIELVEVPAKDAVKFMMNEEMTRPPGMMFGIMWFHANKYIEVDSI